MSSRVARDRLSLHLDAVLEDVIEPDVVPEAPVLRFEAFLADARIFGHVHLAADRLTDLLNAHPALDLHAATRENLLDGTTLSSEQVLVPRSQLVAVLATGPRGDPALRRWTRAYPVAVQAGSYLIGGYAHATPSHDPLRSIADRPPMVPLTDAWMEYWRGGERIQQWVGTIIFNRDLAGSVRAVAEEELEFGQLRPGPEAA